MPYVLNRFGFNDMMDCRGRLRDLLEDGPETFEEAAERAVEFFHREFVDDSGQPACALVRFFKTASSPSSASAACSPPATSSP